MVVIYRTIQACMILHNILTELHDDPTDIEGFDGADDAVDDVEIVEGDRVQEQVARTLDGMDDATLYQTGLIRRKELLKFKYQ